MRGRIVTSPAVSVIVLVSLLVGVGCHDSASGPAAHDGSAIDSPAREAAPDGTCHADEMLPRFGCATPEALSCRQRTPSVQTGVYGCVTAQDDVGLFNKLEAFPRFPIEIFTNRPPPTPDDGLTPVAKVRSDHVGFYQLTLSPGRYWICTTFRRCGQLDVPASPPVKMNYHFGQGPSDF
jgi:hypothetical protein